MFSSYSPDTRHEIFSPFWIFISNGMTTLHFTRRLIIFYNISTTCPTSLVNEWIYDSIIFLYHILTTFINIGPPSSEINSLGGCRNTIISGIFITFSYGSILAIEPLILRIFVRKTSSFMPTNTRRKANLS